MIGGETLREHPNASLAAALSSPTAGIIWLLGRWGVTLSAYDGAYIAAGWIVLGLAVGRRGVRGMVQRVWRGEG